MKPDPGVRTIHVLDPGTVNQIAAGEVVERPASVVKELVENAIDAGSTAIHVNLASAAGTITIIRVTDNGCGMSPDDAKLAFTPHATSKIAVIGDLHHIHTMGFRGEALASIAAVAKVTLVTKARNGNSLSGTRLIVTGGVLTDTTETGAREGTTVIVEDLFFNTPARKKFLKNQNTEIAHIHAIMEGICLAHPDIAFRLTHNNREQLVTDRTMQVTDTIARLFGSPVAESLIPVRATVPFMEISGYISHPSLSRKDTTRLYVAINHRFVSSPLITGAVREGYGTLLPRDRFPVAVLSFSIDTELVDVNVHPTKKQVRLSHEKEIARAIRETISNALLQSDLIPDAAMPAPSRETGCNPLTGSVPETGQDFFYNHTGDLPAGIAEPTHTGTIATDRQLRQTELATGVLPVTTLVPEMEVIGQFGGIYILATTPSGELMIVDQHAAHERILYEQVAGKTREKPRAQELIVPAVLHRTPREAAVLRNLIPALALEGVHIEEFGTDTFIIRAIPVILGKQEGTGFIDEMISDLVSPDTTRTVSDRERITRIIACRGAIKAGTVCTQEQCQRIIDQLRLTRSPFTCPHGRPTVIRFSRAQLDEMFKRT
ncbi:MAG: DNA mismatch repair endonuclease MutL [Methanoregula sp.]